MRKWSIFQCMRFYVGASITYYAAFEAAHSRLLLMTAVLEGEDYVQSRVTDCLMIANTPVRLYRPDSPDKHETRLTPRGQTDPATVG